MTSGFSWGQVVTIAAGVILAGLVIGLVSRMV